MTAEEIIKEMHRRMKLRKHPGMPADKYLEAAIQVMFELVAETLAEKK